MPSFRALKNTLLWSLSGYAWIYKHSNASFLYWLAQKSVPLLNKTLHHPSIRPPMCETFVSPLNSSKLPRFASNNILTDNTLPKPDQTLSKSSRQHYWWQMVSLHTSPNRGTVLEITLPLYDYVGGQHVIPVQLLNLAEHKHLEEFQSTRRTIIAHDFMWTVYLLAFS